LKEPDLFRFIKCYKNLKPKNLFSRQLKYLLKQGAFAKVILARFLIILFKKNKNIQLITLNYNTNHLFKNSLIIINYQFNNALWYSFNNKKTLEKSIKIFNLENIDSNLTFIVYGFFRKKKYILKFDPMLKIENKNFKTNFSNLSLNLKKNSIPKLTHSFVKICISEPQLKKTKIIATKLTFDINHNNYNKNEFI